jgi:cephalosporin hydroxylase
LTNITIGENVYIASDKYSEPFPNNFRKFYESQHKRAGTYTWNGRRWSRQ